MLRCLVATVGKDAPGTNAALRAVTRLALRRGMEVYGAKRGFLGILRGQFWKLKDADVNAVLAKGGSLLGSTDFRVQPEDQESIDRLAHSIKKFDIVAVLGGLGSFAVLNRVYSTNEMGLTTTMFIPATVEGEFLNPLQTRDLEPDSVHAEAIGTDTAANTAVAAIDRLREQSYHSRTVFLVQCVGAKSNVLPIQIGLACGAHRIYLPKYPLLSQESKEEIKELYGADFDPNYVDVKELVSWIETMFEESQRTYAIVVLPHGIPMVNLSAQGQDDDAEEYARIITSMASLELTVLRVADALSIHFSEPNAIQVRYVLLDDLQRGGVPTLRDRLLGSLYGEAAVEEFLSMYNFQDAERRGNLNLLAIGDTSRIGWKCFTRQKVTPLFEGPNPRTGGLDPLPFFRQSRGTVSGYKPLATL